MIEIKGLAKWKTGLRVTSASTIKRLTVTDKRFKVYRINSLAMYQDI
ncbi:MAG: hypothetical protein JRI99_00990 [Deltaproteobacteria bacterium]|nr:hypothetical protein [Deltaproteobacteria bacterium]